MKIGWEEEKYKNAQKMLVAQANNSKAGSLDMPSDFPGTAFQIHQGWYAANDLFIQIYLRANTAHDQFLESPTWKIFFSKNSDMDSNALSDCNSSPPISEPTLP